MIHILRVIIRELFLYIVPLKQGLKLSDFVSVFFSGSGFLYIVPLKQGLKLSLVLAENLV